MMTNTEYNPKLLEQWSMDVNDIQELEELLQSYLHRYDTLFVSKKQRSHFSTFVKGLLSSLDRKSIEPIALHFLGEKAVRSLQQFFTRSPMDEQRFRDIYQSMLAEQINSSNAMLSVDDSSFVKKGTHSVGVKRQYCGRLGKRENCQVGVFLAYAGDFGYGLVDCDLYIPQDWYEESHGSLRKKCRLPEEKVFLTKKQIAQNMVNRVFEKGILKVQWFGCDAAYGNDHAFLDGLKLPDNVWYFAATNAKEQVFLEYPQEYIPEKKSGRGRPCQHPKWTISPVSVKSIAEDPDTQWERVSLAEGSKGPIMAKRTIRRCVACRTDKNRNYQKPGNDIWLYIRKYEDGTIKYFVSNAPEDISHSELDKAATLRWPIEQCFEECKSYLGMSHYEGRSYTGWVRHMLFVMAAHLFTTQVRENVKKKESH